MGAAGVVGVAGCLGDADEEDTDTDDDDDDDGVAEADEDFDLDNLVEGGTFTIGVGANVASYDPPNSADTTASLAQFFIFEGLTTSDTEGNVYPWLAEDYELLETNDIDRSAYNDYMISVEAGEEGVVQHDREILIQDPPVAEEGDEVGILTPEQAADAIADGTFGMQYRYYLREGVEFSNGEELTAEHVVKTAERYENTVVAPQTFDSVLYVDEVDEYTVDIYAQVPDAEAERELPGFLIHTLDQAELPGGDLDPREGNVPIGTGPYVLEEFEDEQYAEYSKNENYWVEQMGVHSIDWFDGPDNFPDGPTIDEIVVEIIPDDATRSGALQNEEIDATTGLTTDTLNDYDASDDFVVTAVETGGYEYFQTPLQLEPWSDQRLRQAFNHLVPRQAIVDNVLAGWARPAWTMIPELAQGTGTADAEALEEELRPLNEYDPERAVELIEEVFDEYDIEAPMEIQLDVNADNDDRVQMVELVAEAMEQTGYFETEIETFEWNQYVARILDPGYAETESIGCVGLSGTFSPHSFCDALHHSNNWGACCNLKGVNFDWLDEMLDGARFGTEVAEDPDLRRERYDELWHELADLAASSITHFDLQTTVVNNDVKGYAQWPFHEGSYSFALYSPVEEQVIYIQRDD